MNESRHDEYLKAKKSGEKAFRTAAAQGQYPYLPAMDDFVDSSALSKVSLGIMEIPLSMVTGTKTSGRQQSFACNFMPLMEEGTEFAAKWTSLYAYQMSEGITDAVTVFEYMHHFYVQEGNKRVSVLKHLKAPEITADVTRILPARPDALYSAFLKFYNVCPLYEISFTSAASYAKLAKLLGMDLEHRWPEERTAALKAAYYRFLDVYEQEGYAAKSEPSDAFLLYISVYGFEKVRYLSGAAAAAKLRLLEKELEAANTDIAVKDTPDEAVTGLFGLNKLIPAYTENRPLRISFLYEDTPDGSEWDYEHEVGRKYLKQRFGGLVETQVFCRSRRETTLKEDLEKAAVKSDAVFTVSPVQMEATIAAAVRHPAVRFLNCSIHMNSRAVRTYYARMHEVKFLLGALAAMVSENHRICYIADYPIYGTVASINAFAIGASMIDPYARIFLGWSGVHDSGWFEMLDDLDIRVFCGPDLVRPQDDNIRYGLCRKEDDGTTVSLAIPVINWAKYYELLVQRILDGMWEKDASAVRNTAINYWWGMNAGVIGMNLSSSVPSSSKKLLSQLQNDIMNGSLSVFSGDLFSQNGQVCREGQKLSHTEIIRMDWLNQNVVGVLPEYSRLSETGKKLTDVSGVSAVKETKPE